MTTYKTVVREHGNICDTVESYHRGVEEVEVVDGCTILKDDNGKVVAVIPQGKRVEQL